MTGSETGGPSAREPFAPGSIRLPLAILGGFLLADWLQEVLSLLPVYRGLYDGFPYWVPESAKSLLQIALVAGVVMLLRRVGPGRTIQVLGLSKAPGRGVVAAVVAVVPLWVVFGVTTPLAGAFPIASVAYLSVLSPLAEEVVYRAFAFGELRRLAGWGFWPAALVPAVIFGWGHAEGAGDLGAAAGLFALTAAGSLLFAWLYEAWGFDLWVPFALHMLMNLSWSVFDVGDTALAGCYPTALQVTTLGLIVALTLLRHRLPGLGRRAETP